MAKLLILLLATCLLLERSNAESQVVQLLRRLAALDKRMNGPPAPHGFLKFGGNCPGAQLLGTKMQLLEIHECAIQCLADNECAGFSYGGKHEKECRLKTSVCLYPLSTSKATFYARMNEGDKSKETVKSGVKDDFDKMQGNCPGNQIGELSQRSLDGCAWNCLHTPNCVGFSYGGWLKTDCRLKNEACENPLAGLAIFYKLNQHKKEQNANGLGDNHKGGSPQEPTTHPPDFYLKDFKKVGGDCVASLKILTDATLEECAQACVTDGEINHLCGGFSVVPDQNICYLKQNCIHPASPSAAIYYDRINGGPPKPSTNPPTEASGDLLQEIRRECLSEINKLRAKHCADPLQVNATLEVAAQEWAEHEAKVGAPMTSAWVHNYQEKAKELGWPPLSIGQNLGYFPYDWPEYQPVTAKKICQSVVTDQWYGEVKEYEATGGYDQRAANALWGPYLHFVQLVWRDTKYVGIGYKDGRVAADFSPMSGIAPVENYYRNVKAPRCGRRRLEMEDRDESFDWEE